MVLLILWISAAQDHMVVARNIFCSGCGERAPPPYELVSTLVCPREPPWSRALLRDKLSGEMHLFGPGDRVGELRLERVASQFVVLSADGASWRLLLQQPPAATPPPPRNHCDAGRCTLERAEVERMLAHPELLGARAVATSDGWILKLTAGSPLKQLGLRDGDHLRAIDGTPLDVNSLMRLWPKLRNASRFALTVLREGHPLTFEVAVN